MTLLTPAPVAIFVQRLTASPEAFCAGCLVWIPIAIWIISMVGWMITGEVETFFGILAIALGLMLGYLTSNPPVDSMAPLFFLMVVGTMVFFPFLRHAIHRRELAALDLERLEDAYRGLNQNSRNPLPAFRLAEILWDRGLPGHAIAIADRALTGQQVDVFRDEIQVIKRWKATPLKPDAYRSLACLRCRTLNPPGEFFCVKCGDDFLMDIARGAWLPRSVALKWLGGWILVVMLLAAVPAAAQLLPPALAVPVIVGALGLGGFAAYRGFRSAMAGAASN